MGQHFVLMEDKTRRLLYNEPANKIDRLIKRDLVHCATSRNARLEVFHKFTWPKDIMFVTLLNIKEFLNCVELIAFLRNCHVCFQTCHMLGKGTNFGIRFILTIFFYQAPRMLQIWQLLIQKQRSKIISTSELCTTRSGWLSSPTDKSKAQTIRLKCERDCGRE